MEETTRACELCGERIEAFEQWLCGQGCSASTVRVYGFALRQLQERQGGSPDQAALLAHRSWLAESYAPKTANLRITAINTWLDWQQSPLAHLRRIRLQQLPFLDNVISYEQYVALRDGLQAEGDLYWHFVVRFLAGTGARVSELVRFRVGDVRRGYMDLVGKGDKLRRIWIPKALQTDAVAWLADRADDQLLFCNPKGAALSTRALSYGLKRAARRHGVPEEVCYPHSFRHLFARQFIQRKPDLALLADLMGHESIETTRIYLRKTAAEQRADVDAVVVW